MRAGLLGMVAMVVGCAPPDLIRTIDILFPTTDTGTIPINLRGEVELLVVVDIGGFEVLPEGEADPTSDTEGHWHLYVNNQYKGAVSDGFVEETTVTGVAIGESLSITVALARDNHDEIEDADGRIDRTIELIVAGPLEE